MLPNKRKYHVSYIREKTQIVIDSKIITNIKKQETGAL